MTTVASKTAKSKVIIKSNDTGLLIEKLKTGGPKMDTLKQSKIVKQLIKKQMKPIDIAKQSGISNAHIYNMMKIQRWPAEVLNIINDETNKVGVTEVLILSRKLSDKELIEKVKQMVKFRKEHPKASVMSTTIQQKFMASNVKKLSQKDKVEFQRRLKKLLVDYSPLAITMSKVKTAFKSISQVAAVS